MFAVPSMLGQVADHMSAPCEQPITLLCAGARLERSVRERVSDRLPNATIVEYYGASELSFVTIRVDGDGTPVGSVGRAFPGVSITIRDDDGHVLPPATSGRIFVQSNLVFSGYRGVIPESAAVQVGDAWTVGDLGSVDEEGYLTVDGRGSALIIVAGANVQPEEVEGVLAEVTGVGQVAVIGVDDPRLGQRLVACIVPSGPLPPRATLRTHISRRLAQHKHPHRYVQLPGPLPLGRTGKVDRDRVKEMVGAGAGLEIR
jgi:acyl-CoA synthetase (AMP-forming)/AMP-acid ligase II